MLNRYLKTIDSNPQTRYAYTQIDMGSLGPQPKNGSAEAVSQFRNETDLLELLRRPAAEEMNMTFGEERPEDTEWRQRQMAPKMETVLPLDTVQVAKHSTIAADILSHRNHDQVKQMSDDGEVESDAFDVR